MKSNQEVFAGWQTCGKVKVKRPKIKHQSIIMKLNLEVLINLDLSYQFRANYTKRTTEIQHDRGMFLMIPLVMMMMMILSMTVVTYFEKTHFYLVRC